MPTVSHYQDLANHQLEHVVAELLTLEERGAATRDELSRVSRVDRLDAVLDRLESRGHVRRTGGNLSLTPEGRRLARQVVRRHRLAELLLATVLDATEDPTVDRTACVIEHVLGAAATDSVCAFLGHPKFCPHGKPIPPGRCCRSFSNAVEPLVQPLESLAVGETARVVFIVPSDPKHLVRLSSLGLVPGATVRLVQRSPATVLEIGETTLALDPEIAAQIYAKRVA